MLFIVKRGVGLHIQKNAAAFVRFLLALVKEAVVERRHLRKGKTKWIGGGLKNTIRPILTTTNRASCLMGGTRNNSLENYLETL